ncbi:hypothetical protein [Chryseolinea lacunae]|uniref:Uncharacterized protein n=1 Tax=Chryseolinea lacunae TaxID=2801331 RepID=A0ABS1KXP7_9BACT|nr:hypothetical protein [Chryseolinea lacunae]MBL0744174.1 hypothetical protein [Chryseolinea lacunae]
MKMKHLVIIKSKLHGIIDYLFVVFLIFAPALFHLKLPAAFWIFTWGPIHLALTLCTNFDFGIFKIIPFKTHGRIELAISFTLIAGAFFVGYREGNLVNSFYMGLGSAVFFIWLATDYTSSSARTQH